MANLLEALQPQMQDTTSQLSTLLRAKSGKAVGAPATAISTQQEQAAVAQAGQAMEQLGQNLRLNNQKYVDNLQREGSRARLNDDIQFREQVAKSVLQDNKSLLEKQLGNRSILSASDREFSIAMARMGVQDAWQMFRNESNAQQSAAQWSTGASLINTGLGAYGTYQERVEKAKDRSIARGTNVQRPFGQDQTDETLSGAKGRQS